MHNAKQVSDNLMTYRCVIIIKCADITDVTVTGVTFQSVTPVTLCNSTDTLVTVICLGKRLALED